MKPERIKIIALKLIKKFDSNNPYVIAKALGIIVTKEPLGKIRGLYNTEFKQKFIHINNNISSHTQRFVCAHELGHAVLHPDNNTHFLRDHSLYSINRFENEATLFATYCLISDSDLQEYNYYTYAQIAKLFGVSENVIQMRVNGI